MTTRERAGTERVPSGARFAARRGVRSLLVLGTLLGCGGRHDAPAPSTDALPTVIAEGSITGIDGLSPRSRIALGEDGAWLFAAPRVSQSALVLVDPAGSQRPIGGVGEGPGEARFAIPMRLAGDSVVAFDLATRRLLHWTRGGRLLESRTTEAGALPLFWTPGDRLLGVRGGPGGRLPVLLDATTLESVTPVSPEDSLYRDLFGAPRSEVGRVEPPVLGSWREGVVIGDGMRFTFGLYDVEGRLRDIAQLDLPARRRTTAEVERLVAAAVGAGMLQGGAAGIEAERLRLAEEQVPWVSSQSHPRSDARGRLWILRATDVDSLVAAELFAGGTHLGTLPLWCHGFAGEWALTADRLALVCLPADAESADDAVLRQYRIDEPRADLTN